MTLEDFLSRLEAVKQTPRGAKAQCPAHEDKNPSLSISEGERGLLVKCWAGCTVKEITAALGITVNELFYDSTPAPRGQRAHPVRRPWRFDWRRVSADFLYHAEGLRLRAESVFGAAKGLDVSGWSHEQLNRAMDAVCQAHSDIDRAALLESVAFTMRRNSLERERCEYARHRAA